jgi:hypothetical protein
MYQNNQVHRLEQHLRKIYYSKQYQSPSIAARPTSQRQSKSSRQINHNLPEMDTLPTIRPRTPTGPLGYLNYPPEIMNRIYREVLVDESEVLAFLCSPDPSFNFIGLKRAAADHQSPRSDPLDWPELYDARYYTDSNGRSAQFLRVCRKIQSEATPVLYGNLTIAMRWTPRHPDPCVSRFFKRNAAYVVAHAKFVYPKYTRPWYTPNSIGK